MPIDNTVVNDTKENKEKLVNTFTDLVEFDNLLEFLVKSTGASINGNKTVLSINMGISGNKPPEDGLVEGDKIVTSITVHNHDTGEPETLTQTYTFVNGFINNVVLLAINEGKNLAESTINTF